MSATSEPIAKVNYMEVRKGYNLPVKDIMSTNMLTEIHSLTYLKIERVIIFTIKVTFAIPVWVIIQGYESAVDHAPTILPCFARVRFDPSFSFSLLSRDWHAHSLLHKLRLKDGCHHPAGHQTH
jgi:hypothetical protein